ncbi:helix-turn-helix domain-containing protein [Candidatus Frankia alpina]|uniref:Helix-turn-helix domain-containing protein n=1 Tax=Candidatus Frankia alpina TaxID=2699483 RepID=A0A4S5CW96_9ACTN|nr:helix-turn-helix domain-containing protein [Candidatus Frankia alpina]
MRESIDNFEPLLDYTDIANLAGISPDTARAYRSSGHLPKPDQQTSSRRPRWKLSTVRAWLENRPGPGARTDLWRKREQAEAGEGSPEEGEPPVAVA